MNGKGSKRRPRLVSREVEDKNWRETFGPHDPLDLLERLPQVESSDRDVSYRAFRLNYMRALGRKEKP